jgi:serine/threonine protein kinase
LKLTTRGERWDELAVSLLNREAAVEREVNHPNLVSLLGSDLSVRAPLVILPYLDGVNLRRLLHSIYGASEGSAGLLPVSLALSMARQTATALTALHDAGWLHSQVRPEHIVLSPQGHVTLIDLTQARRLASSECDADGSSPLSPHFAAPEASLGGGQLMAATDIYSLGVTLFAALTGRLPFQASSSRRLVIAHRREAPANLRDLRRDASLELAELVHRMLAKEPLRRPSARQLVRWLAELEIEELAN